MSEKELEFKSFDEATQALRMELENLTMADKFPDSTFEIAQQVIKLAKGDETFESQIKGIFGDFIAQKAELADKYNKLDEEGKKKLLEQIQKSLNNFLRVLEQRH